MKRFLLAVLLLASLSFAAEADDIAAGRTLVQSNASCSIMNSSQLELIGDYYMEQMHPGAAHDAMDRMLGGEGSSALAAAHIQMAQVIYCGQTNGTATYGGMMGMFPLFASGPGYGPRFGGMMGSGMMGNWGYGMMGDWWWVFGAAFWLLLFAALVLVVVWLYRQVMGKGSQASASDILKQRYARGELTKKQFEEMKKDLGEE